MGLVVDLDVVVAGQFLVVVGLVVAISVWWCGWVFGWFCVLMAWISSWFCWLILAWIDSC